MLVATNKYYWCDLHLSGISYILLHILLVVFLFLLVSTSTVVAQWEQEHYNAQIIYNIFFFVFHTLFFLRKVVEFSANCTTFRQTGTFHICFFISFHKYLFSFRIISLRLVRCYSSFPYKWTIACHKLKIGCKKCIVQSSLYFCAQHMSTLQIYPTFAILAY